MKFDFIWPSVLEEKMFKIVDDRWQEAYLSYKLTTEPSAQVS